MISHPQAAQYALMVNAAMSASVAAGLPDLSPSVTIPGWTLWGHLIARDHWGPIGQDVCYGYLAQNVANPDEFAAVIRGTHGTTEWAIDGEFFPRRHSLTGTVEDGFWSVYDTMRYIPKGGQASAAPSALATAVGAGKLMVVGHSLGAAVATYLAFDMAWLLRERASACLLASPHPGNAVFCRAFDSRVSDYQVFDYEPDIVPDVPAGPDYAALPKRTVLPRSMTIRDDVECHHNVLSYAALLDQSVANALALQSGGCVRA